MSHTSSYKGGSLLFILYVVFCSSFLCALIPVGGLSIFASMICICALSALYTYRVRGRKAKNLFVIRHTTYLIHSFWQANILLAATCFIALLYILIVIDYQPLEACSGALLSAAEHGRVDTMLRLYNICGRLLFEANKLHMYIAGFIAIIPIFFYISWQFLSGLTLLLLGRVVPKKKIRG